MVTLRRTFAAGLGVWALVVLMCGGSSVRATGAPAGARLTGSVVDNALTGIPKASVILEQAGHVVATVMTDEAGAYVVPDLPPGDYQVRVEVGGKTIATRTIHVATDAKTLTLPIVATRDPHATAQGGDFTVDQRLKAPTAPDPWQVVNMAPGVVLNGANAGGSASGQQITTNGFGTSGQVQWNLEGGGIADLSSGKAVAGGRGGGGAVAASPASGGQVFAQPVLPDTDRRNPWPPYPGETYAPIEANGFQPAREHPLSTFGADVDTASYTERPALLAAGQLPPSDAVRIEELVNYFHFSYPEPRDGRPIALTTEIGDCPWAPSHKLVLVGARAAASRDRETAGRNIVLAHRRLGVDAASRTAAAHQDGVRHVRRHLASRRHGVDDRDLRRHERRRALADGRAPA